MCCLRNAFQLVSWPTNIFSHPHWQDLLPPHYPLRPDPMVGVLCGASEALADLALSDHLFLHAKSVCPHTHQAHLAHRSSCTKPWNCRSLILPHLPQSFPALHLLLAGHTHQCKQKPPWGPRLASVQFGALACLLFCWWPISLCATSVFCMEAPNARELECSSLPHLLP